MTTGPTPPREEVDGGTVVALVLSSSVAVGEAQRLLAAAGFSVGPPSGPTFAIQASVEQFTRTFGVAPVRAPDGGWTTGAGDELPLDGLGEPLRTALTAIAFERPAELLGP